MTYQVKIYMKRIASNNKMKIIAFAILILASCNIHAQQMDSVRMKRLADSFRLCSNKMFIRMDSVPSLRNGKNINAVAVSRKQLDSIILKLTEVVKNKRFEDISNQEHIEIIRFLNWFEIKDKDEPQIKILINLLWDSFYEWKLTCRFHWTYSPGMGFHINELEAELDGKSRTRFEIKD